jgi:hypothetical protein
MADIEKALATFEANIARETGRPVAEWGARALAAGMQRHGEIVSWLKQQHGLSHSHANQIAKRALQPAAETAGGDNVDHLFQGGREGLRPIYDGIVAAAKSLGADVSLAPKKNNVSVRRRRQFALLQPSTRTRLDVGLILKARAPDGRLEPSGSFNAMFTHRVRIERPEQVDAELRQWLKEAYDEAA